MSGMIAAELINRENLDITKLDLETLSKMQEEYYITAIKSDIFNKNGVNHQLISLDINFDKGTYPISTYIQSGNELYKSLCGRLFNGIDRIENRRFELFRKYKDESPVRNEEEFKKFMAPYVLWDDQIIARDKDIIKQVIEKLDSQIVLDTMKWLKSFKKLQYTPLYCMQFTDKKYIYDDVTSFFLQKSSDVYNFILGWHEFSLNSDENKRILDFIKSRIFLFSSEFRLNSCQPKMKL